MNAIKYLQRVKAKTKKGFTLIEILVAANIGVIFLMLIFLLLRNYFNSADIIKTKIELEQNSVFILKYIQEDLNDTDHLNRTKNTISINRRDNTMAKYTVISTGELRYSKYGKPNIGNVELANNVNKLTVVDKVTYFEISLVLKKEGVIVEKQEKVFKNVYGQSNRIYND